MVGLFSTASKESQIGVDFLSDGVAVAQVLTGSKNPGSMVRAEFIEANGQEAQVEALRKWVRGHGLQKTPCVCLVAHDDCDVYQVEKPEVEESEMMQAVTWKIKDLISYDVGNAVVDSYPMPLSSKNSQQQVGVVSAHDTVIGSYVDSIRSSAMRLRTLDIHDLVRSNLQVVRQSADNSLALMTFGSPLYPIEQHININNGVTDFQFAQQSPGQRLFVIEDPVSYICNPATGRLRRHDSYGFNLVQPTAPGGSSVTVTTQLLGCSMTYAAGTSWRGGILSIEITIGDGSGENVNLLHQVHVENVP
ncbi:MAG: hypothetical protein GY815_06325 [Gammaproteobacteria bacterium]|nr:hypothetical protein [Gammaproteobacteria bacterium]